MFDRLLEPNSTDVPDCACGKAMRYVKLEKRSEDAAVKHFQCDCGREFLLMVWPELTFSPAAAAA
ncbi:hypothetical protein [Rhodoplanes sp. Z2-YC6860]|uniref:hypothetical protein n=1 Tax=Rhodoplanes sp. Z2-YC6860 TaxID=674703 RepID=UPI0012ECF104|nr:hypothetical protein [Rhodoplanes sp. Z2-YC6860]